MVRLRPQLGTAEVRSGDEGQYAAVDRTGCRVYACTIMPDHVHMVIARHRYDVEQLVGLLKGDATRHLQAEGLHPMTPHVRPGSSVPTPWVRNCWKVFLDDRADIDRAIQYVQRNPLKEGMRAQHWSFLNTSR